MVPEVRLCLQRPHPGLQKVRKSKLAKGNTERHADLVTARARKVFNGCGFKRYGDIVGTDVASYLDDLRADTKDGDGNVKRGISAQTFNFYLQAVK